MRSTYQIRAAQSHYDSTFDNRRFRQVSYLSVISYELTATVSYDRVRGTTQFPVYRRFTDCPFTRPCTRDRMHYNRHHILQPASSMLWYTPSGGCCASIYLLMSEPRRNNEKLDYALRRSCRKMKCRDRLQSCS